MKAVCKFNDPNSVPSGVPDNFDYGLEIGKEYLVMGVVLSENQLWYLVDENGRPGFYPFQLFQISDASIHSGWQIKLYEKDDGIFPFNKIAIWGYCELCSDEAHYEKLVDRESKALEIYFKRKLELEKSEI